MVVNKKEKSTLVIAVGSIAAIPFFLFATFSPVVIIAKALKYQKFNTWLQIVSVVSLMLTPVFINKYSIQESRARKEFLSVLPGTWKTTAKARTVFLHSRKM